MKRIVSKTASFALCMAVMCASAVLLFANRNDKKEPICPTPCDSVLSSVAGEIDAMCAAGIMPTSSIDGRCYFYPTVPVTREYFAYVLARYLGIDDGFTSSLSIGVNDENDISPRFLGGVRSVVHAGLLPIYEDCGIYVFCPTEELTRSQVAEVMAGMVGQSVSSEKSDSFCDIGDDENASAIDTMIGLNIMTGFADGTFRPENIVTRQELAHIFYRLCEMNQ
ncbi:MAG: S-layer homology domain-containing protein [Clostridia bacterium]|nr:S-layer homology domain-containing protein [Clostridia bacterium]